MQVSIPPTQVVNATWDVGASLVSRGKVREDGTVAPLDVKKGDKVLFSKYGGTDVKVGDEEYLILREDDILGVVESGLV